ncbi:MAG: pyridoxal phosphate-dependent aminotransferase [Chloroflexota bacterium]
MRESMERGSGIRRMFEEGINLKQKLGADNVFDLSLGNPMMEPPPEFQQELRRLAEHPIPGMHRYMENAGYPDTRASVAEQLQKETGVPFTLNEIVMTCGAAAGLNVVLKTILNPGEEVIIFSPYFVEYTNYVDNCGGVSRILSTDEQFLPRLEELEKAVTPKTKAVLINSPNNPTGVVYGESLLSGIGALLRRKESEYGTAIFLVSDEPYRRIIYDGLKYPHIWKHHRQTIAATSHSKDLSLPGERIGYIAVNPECRDRVDVMAGLIYCNRTLGFVNAPALMQHLMRRLQGVSVAVAEYQRKRDFLYRHLTEAGYSLVKPQGAFYMFPRSLIPDDAAFVRELLQWGVLTVPGRAFGSPGHFRIAYCVDDRTIEGSIRGFREAGRKFKH